MARDKQQGNSANAFLVDFSFLRLVEKQMELFQSNRIKIFSRVAIIFSLALGIASCEYEITQKIAGAVSAGNEPVSGMKIFIAHGTASKDCKPSDSIVTTDSNGKFSLSRRALRGRLDDVPQVRYALRFG